MKLVELILVFLGVAAAANITDRISGLEQQLRNHYDVYMAAAPDVDSECAFYRACPHTVAFGTYLASYHNDTQFNGTNVNRDAVLFKHPPGADVAIPTTDVCRVQSRMLAAWSATLDLHDVLWQYVGLQNGLVAWFPAPDWLAVGDGCPGAYHVERRPWFFAGRSGQFDIVFLVDTTGSADDVASMRSFVVSMLGTLSFRHYANVIVFNSAPMPAFAHLQQVDLDGIITNTARGLVGLQDAARRLIVKDGDRPPDLVQALQAALDMLGVSKAAGESSGCDQVIVLLSSGGMSGLTRDVSRLVYGQVRVMSMVVDSANAAPASLGPKLAACASDGFTLVNPAGSFNMTLVIYQFLESGLSDAHISIRAAEVYHDFFTGLAITTITLPVLGGMLAIDVKLDGLDVATAAGVDQLNAQLLAAQQCESRDIPSTAAVAVQDGVDICAAIEGGSGMMGQNALDKHRNVIIGVTVAGVYLITIGILYVFVYVEGDKPARSPLVACLILLTVACLVLWPLFFGLLYTPNAMWDDMVRLRYWERATVTTQSQAIHPFRCCDIVNCECANVDAPSCVGLRNNLVAGVCDHGYHCCQEVCYSCHCYTTYTGGMYSSYTTRCSTCCNCVQAVTHRRCQTACGTCHRVTMDLTYVDVHGHLQRTAAAKICPRTDGIIADPAALPCVRDYSSQYMPIGRTREIYYNPENPSEFADELSYKTVHLVFFIIACVSLCIVYLYTIGLFVTMCMHVEI